MPTKRQFLFGTTTLFAGASAMSLMKLFGNDANAREGAFEIIRSNEEWRKILTPEQYYVLREHGTERAGTSPLDREKRAGTFICAGCDLPLFESAKKFDSGTGWPSFWTPIENAIGTKDDSRFFMKRTEVHCRRCGGHLGHVFEDGPAPTGLRYCMNGVAMKFVAAAGQP
jgi:peptide-methionine (R)-S-oxide reductase